MRQPLLFHSKSIKALTHAHPNIPLPQRLAKDRPCHQRARRLALLPLRNPRFATRRSTIFIKRQSIADPSTPLGLQPGQQQPREPGGTLYGLPPPCPPQASWKHLDRSGNIGAERREPTASSSGAAGTSGDAVEPMGARESLAPVGALGLIGGDVGADL